MRRPQFFVVGLLAYGAALASMGYFALFLANIFVPKGVDSGSPGSPAAAFAVDAALLLAFGLTHSLMARREFWTGLFRRIPPALERAVYSLVAGLQIALLCWLYEPLPGAVWGLSVSHPAVAAGLWAVQALGWAVTLWAVATLGAGHLFGFEQAAAAARGTAYSPPPLAERGPYRYVRHPIYAGTLLAFWATAEMSQGRLLLVAGMTVYLFVGLHFEERDLEAQWGEAFRARRRRLPGWVPFRLQ